MLFQLSLLASLLVLNQGLALSGEDVSDPARPFQLTVSPALVNRYTSDSMTLRCARNPRVQTKMTKVFRMRIVKKSGTSWNLVAEQRDIDNAPTVEGTVEAQSSINGNISDAFLQVSWANVGDENFGVYKCDVIGFDANYNTVIERTADDDLRESDVPDEYFVEMSKATQEKVSELQKTTNVEFPLLKAEFKSLQQSCASLETRLTSLTQWPGGYYALVQPKTGCPLDLAFFGGTHKFQRLYTEWAGSEEKDTFSSAFFEQTTFTNGGKRFVTFEFCEVNQPMSSAAWPRGSYCIHKLIHKDCPAGFTNGSVFVTTEMRKPSGEGRNNIADRSTNPTMGFCCQQSADLAAVPVQLPTDHPFVLYRMGGSCQTVQGMSVSEEFIQVNSEDTNNKDKLTGKLPDIDQPPGSLLRFHMCYYTKE